MGEMVAIRKLRPGSGLDLTSIKVPNIGKNDVLIKVKACSVCGTDIHIYNWEHPWSERIITPRTIGHELAGEVIEVGKNVNSVYAGDYVSVESHIVCGECVHCRTGMAHICEKVKILGIDTDGCFAEYVSVPGENVWKNPKNMSPEIATLQEPMGNSVYTVYSGNVSGKSVSIFGCGPLGLFAVGLARVAGAAKIIAVDLIDTRLKIAKEMGADLVIDTREQDVIKEIMDATDGIGADVFLEMSGSPVAIEQGFKTLRSGGNVVALGLPTGPVKLDWSKDVVLKLANIQGISGREMFNTWHMMSRILASGKLDISPIITHKFKLDEFEKAMEIAKSREAGKIILYP